jgi:predicted dienelactone hydrolase
MICFLALLTTCTAVDPAEDGPYPVGAMTIAVTRTDQTDRKFLTEIWHPAIPQATSEPAHYGTGMPTRAFWQARVADGRFPLIIFSHGMGGMREQSTFLTEHLASHGYIVAAPDHPNNTIHDLSFLENVQSALDRPMDIRAVLDHVVNQAGDPHDPLYRHVRCDRVAVMGHSLGGYTALAVGGALVDAKAHPGKANDPDWPDYFDFSDRRVRAVVALAPYTRPAIDDFGLSRLRVPILVLGGSADAAAPFQRHLWPVFTHAAGPRYLMRIDGAAHLSFANKEFAGIVPPVVRFTDRMTLERARSNALIRAVTLAFLERHLRGQDRFEYLLSQSQKDLEVSFRGIGDAPGQICGHARMPNRRRR